MAILLFLSILLVAACGLVYELIAGTVASYLVGDSVFQFSTVIGTYLFAMGIGSFLSRFVRGNLARLFVRIEILIAVVGGFSPDAPCVAAIVVLSVAFAGGSRIDALAEDNIYADEIIVSRDTPYQHIVLTRWKDDLRLFLNSHLQFSSRDEYRYHEALVHPGLASVPAPRRVLVLGGGDGLAVRDILKYPEIER